MLFIWMATWLVVRFLSLLEERKGAGLQELEAAVALPVVERPASRAGNRIERRTLASVA